VNTVLWIIASVLAVLFLLFGLLKIARPKEKLVASGIAWAEDFGPGVVKTLGALEVLAAIGLILPALLSIAPVLVPLAALGLVVVMVGAAITHVRRKESPGLIVNVVILALAAVVVWGRLGPYAFTS